MDDTSIVDIIVGDSKTAPALFIIRDLVKRAAQSGIRAFPHPHDETRRRLFFGRAFIPNHA
tara:strand:+ start:2730 stop:2912 length:183 start_codon:yes stop_codon:yes gene_type:complete